MIYYDVDARIGMSGSKIMVTDPAWVQANKDGMKGDKDCKAP